jgi:hypothetical protein
MSGADCDLDVGGLVRGWHAHLEASQRNVKPDRDHCTVLAGIVEQSPLGSGRVVALATGTKALARSRIDRDGYAVIPCRIFHVRRTKVSDVVGDVVGYLL